MTSLSCVANVSPISTSLLSNFWIDEGKEFAFRYDDLSEWPRLPLNNIRNTHHDGSTCRAIEDKNFINVLADYGLRFREKSYTEVHDVLSIQIVFTHDPKYVALYPLYARTYNTRVTVHAPTKVFSLYGFSKVSPIELKGISSINEFYRGLIEVLDKVSNTIGSHKNKCRVYTNTTPGFKAETFFITLISLLIGVNIIYIHESLSQPILSLRVPLLIERKELKQLLEILEKIKIHINALTSAIGYDKYTECRDCGLIVMENHKYVLLDPVKIFINTVTKQV